MRKTLALWLALVASQAFAADKGGPALGVSLPLSGPRAEFANTLKDGMRAAVERDSAAPRGRLALKFLDDKGDPALYRANMKALAADPEVVALGMCWNDATCEIAAKEAAAAGLPLVGGISGSQLGSVQQGVFLLRGSYADELAAFHRHAETVRIKRLVLVSDGMSPERLANVTTQAQQGKVALAVESLATIGARPQPGFDAEAYVLGTDAPSAVKVIGALRQMRPISQIYSLSSVAALDLARLMRRDAAGVTIAVHAPSPEVPSSELIREFQDAMDKTGAVNMLTHEQLEAYLAAKVTQRALAASGSGARGAVRQALAATPSVTLSGYRVQLQAPTEKSRARVTLTVVSRNGMLLQ